MIRPQRKRIREVVELCLLCVLVIGACSHARRRERGDDEPARVKTETAVHGDESAQQQRHAPATFLDSINDGREVALREDDLERTSPTDPEPVEPTEQKNSAPKNPAPTREQSPGTLPPQPENVFRIQCMASTQGDAMQQARKKLEARLRYPVFVMFVDPYYKLLVGEFATRDQAERALFEVRGQGYPDAWIIKGAGRAAP